MKNKEKALSFGIGAAAILSVLVVWYFAATYTCLLYTSIEFKHTAHSKAVFGKGAVEAAKFLAGKPAGRYDMSDVIDG